MKNHYCCSYAGNKRNEIKDIMSFINLDNITTILEPFTGSAVMSSYISTLYPNRFKYILNDNDKINYDLFNISRDIERTEELNDKINKIIDEFNTYNDDVNRKIFYNSISMKTLEGYILKNKYIGFRPGVYPLLPINKNIKPYNLQDYPVYDFYNNEDVIYENIDGVEFINKYNEGEGKLFLTDPPYMVSCNEMYNDRDVNIYMWIYYNKPLLLGSQNKILFILENIWIIILLFSDFNILLDYDKDYSLSKKKTTHIVYNN